MNLDYIRGLRTIGSLHNVEADFLAFFQGLVPAFDGRTGRKDLASIIQGNEAIPPDAIELFDTTGWHLASLFVTKAIMRNPCGRWPWGGIPDGTPRAQKGVRSHRAC